MNIILKNLYLYKIRSRNSHFGIFIKERNSFLISRKKFDDNYLFEEYLFDGTRIGTVKPLEEIEKSPFTLEDLTSKYLTINNVKYFGYEKEKEILEYLNKFQISLIHTEKR